MVKTNISILLSILIFSGCATLEPTLEPLDSNVIPKEWNTKIENNSTSNINEIKPSWKNFVQNETLKKVVELAIKNNKDLKIAILNIESARATYRVSKADNFPTINANANTTRAKSLGSTNTTSISQNYNANLSASYEIDLFGKIKSLNESALNSYLSTKYAANNAKITLINETITAWITLANDMEQLKLANETVENLQKVYELNEKKYKAGVISKADVLSANASLKEAQISKISYTKQIEQDKNALELIIAQPLPKELLPKGFEDYQTWLIPVKAGLSSQVLLNRPDVMEAEYTLKAKNANIGAARAAFFPSISLTASSGIASKSLSNLFDGGTGVWSFAPSITLPIFDGGQNSANLDYSYAQKDIALLEYEKTIQTAFKEVNNALITQATINEQIQKQKELVDSVSKSYDISLNSYKVGISTYLEVLINQRTKINAKQTLINTYLEDLTNQITLYGALGGNENIEENIEGRSF